MFGGTHPAPSPPSAPRYAHSVQSSDLDSLLAGGGSFGFGAQQPQQQSTPGVFGSFGQQQQVRVLAAPRLGLIARLRQWY